MDPTATDLLKELRGAGHRLRADGEKLLVTNQIGLDLTEEQIATIKLTRGSLYRLLADEAIEAAMCAAIDDICEHWPRTGPQPPQTLEIIAAEAGMDAALIAEPLDLTMALEVITTWRAAWVATVQRHKDSGHRSRNSPWIADLRAVRDDIDEKRNDYEYLP